jgi:hypothetical protein
MTENATYLQMWTQNDNDLNSLVKRHRMANSYYQDLTICCLIKLISLTNTNIGLGWKDGKSFTNQMEPESKK